MGLRPADALRKTAKGVFAAGDLAFGEWPGPRILIYHQITDSPQKQLDVTPPGFVDQLNWLKENGSIVPLDDVVGAPEESMTADRFVLTFDDGFAGLFEHAFPLLARDRVPFTLYITSGLIGEMNDGAKMLTWAQIDEMQESGLMTIGAHTHSHPDLRELDEARIVEELSVSNDMISENTGVQPRHFAYPKGYWSAAAEPAIRASYATAVLGAGEPVTAATDPHRICRVPVQLSDGPWFFKRKMRGGMRLEEALRRRLKGYQNPPSRIQPLGQSENV